jgi:hypothetical protein
MYDFAQRTAIASGKIYRADIGPLSIWVRIGKHEWHVASERHDERVWERRLSPARKSKEQDALEWTRWISPTVRSEAALFPALPEKPVVIRPAVSTNISPGNSAMLYVGLPVNVLVKIEPSGVVLCEIPTMVLSNTWFGDTVSGELCYSLKSRAVSELFQSEPRPHFATCPVLVKNSSSSMLSFERFILHVEHLSLFNGRTRLWTNTVTVEFRGEEQLSQVNIEKEAPDIEAVGAKLCEPRKPVEKGLLKKSFLAIKTLTGY